jgi:uridine kinase
MKGGPSVLIMELAEALGLSGRPVIRASVDGFHHPRAARYRLGKLSPEGFFRESYDYPTLIAVLLDPLSPGGSRRFRRTVFDVEADSPVDLPWEEAEPRWSLITTI